MMNRTFAAFLSAWFFAFSLPSLAAEVHGVLQVVKGDVQVKSAKDGKLSKAKVGSKIYPKDTILTGKDSRAKIVMVDNNVINVSPETNLEIQNYEYAPEQGKKDVLLNVIYGKVRSKVEQKYDGETTKFQLKTPTAVAGVRGTDFMAGYSPSTNVSSVVTFEGTVAFGQPGPNGTIINPVAVTPGLATEMSGNQAPPPPRPVPPQQLAQMDRESKSEPPPSAAPTSTPDPRAPAGQDKKEEKNDSQEMKQSPGQAQNNEAKKEGPDGEKREPGAQQGQAQGNASGTAKGPGPGGAVGAAAGAAAGAAGGAASGATAAAPSPGGAPSPGAPSPGAMMPGMGREPASSMPAGSPGGGSMLLPSDLAGAPTANVMPNLGPVIPAVPTTSLPPPINVPVCEFCNTLVQDGNNTLIIRVNH